MKLALTGLGILLGLLLGHHSTPLCMDPNTNQPIDCHYLGQ